MKRSKTIRRLISGAALTLVLTVRRAATVLFLMLLTTMTAWAQSEPADGTVEYVVRTWDPTAERMMTTTETACVPVMIHRAEGDVTERLAATFGRVVNIAEEWTTAKGLTYGYVEGALIDGQPYYHYFYGNSGASGEAIMDAINYDTNFTYFALYNDHLYPIEGDPGIPAHRGVLCIYTRALGGSNARQLNIAIDGDATGISTTNYTYFTYFTNSDDAWHTLDGRKVSKPTRGIYIKGGRKVVIK